MWKKITMRNIQVTYKHFSFDGSPEEAISFVDEIHEAYQKTGTDMSKTLHDFVFAIEVALQNAGHLDENFSKVVA